MKVTSWVKSRPTNRWWPLRNRQYVSSNSCYLMSFSRIKLNIVVSWDILSMKEQASQAVALKSILFWIEPLTDDTIQEQSALVNADRHGPCNHSAQRMSKEVPKDPKMCNLGIGQNGRPTLGYTWRVVTSNDQHLWFLEPNKNWPILILKYLELSLLSCSFRFYFIRGTIPTPKMLLKPTICSQEEFPQLLVNVHACPPATK